MLGLRTGSGTTPKREPSTKEGLAQLYFPLTPGSQWTYEFEAGNRLLKQHVEVTGHQEYRGQNWSILEYAVEGQPMVFTKLLRTTQDHLLLYNPSRIEESILIDFGRTEVDPTNLGLGYVESTEETVRVRDITYENCLVVSTGYVENEIGTYAPNVGLIESSWFKGKKQLLSVSIAG